MFIDALILAVFIAIPVIGLILVGVWLSRICNSLCQKIEHCQKEGKSWCQS